MSQVAGQDWTDFVSVPLKGNHGFLAFSVEEQRLNGAGVYIVHYGPEAVSPDAGSNAC